MSINDKELKQIKEYLSEILNISPYVIVVYEQQLYPIDYLNRVFIKFDKYCYSIRKKDFYEVPIDFIVKDIILRYTVHVIDRINVTNKEK